MANRRMFSKTVTSSSKFLRMPVSSRELYFQIGMNADDDGYCEWYSVLLMTGAKQQDLEILHTNGLVFVFDTEVLIVRDWKENNYIPKDRYTASKYLGKYEKMMELEPGVSSLYTERIQVVDEPYTQDRLGKDRIDKDSNTKTITAKSSTSTDTIAEEDKIYLNAWREITNTTLRTKIPQNIAAAKRLKEKYDTQFVKRMMETVRLVKADKYAGRNLQAVGNYIELEKNIEKIEQYRQGLEDRKTFELSTSRNVTSI